MNGERTVYDMVTEHEEQIKQHENTLLQHETTIKLHAEQIKNIEQSSLKLENLVMQENRDTRNTIVQTNRELHELISRILDFKSSQDQLKHSIMLAKIESWVKIFCLLFGSGGILYILFTQ